MVDPGDNQDQLMNLQQFSRDLESVEERLHLSYMMSKLAKDSYILSMAKKQQSGIRTLSNPKVTITPRIFGQHRRRGCLKND